MAALQSGGAKMAAATSITRSGPRIRGHRLALQSLPPAGGGGAVHARADISESAGRDVVAGDRSVKEGFSVVGRDVRAMKLS
jgi:hypothetical protein